MIDAEELPDGWADERLSAPGIAPRNPKKSEVNASPDDTSVLFVPGERALGTKERE